MCPCSVTPIAGIFSSAAWSSSSSMRQAPSSSENSVWRWRWTNSAMNVERKARTARRVNLLCVLSVLCVRCLLPFYGRWWLRADVVHHSIDALHFVDDPRRDVGEQVVRQAGPVRGHPVPALDRSNRDGVLVGPLVPHHTDALHRKQDGKTLPQLRVPAVALHFLRDDGVRLAQQRQSRGRRLPEHAHGEPRPREWLANHELLFQPHLASN